MKDTLITGRAKKRELIIFTVCLIAAILVNLYAITKYDTAWSELYTMAGMVVTIALFFYAVQWIVRLIIKGAVKSFRLFFDHG